MELHNEAEISLIDYWARMPGWTTREQAALLLELNPNEAIPEHKEKDFRALKAVLKRATEMRLLRSPTMPLTFILWAIKNPIPVPVPPALLQAVQATQSKKWISLSTLINQEKSGHVARRRRNWKKYRTYKTVMSVILVMAMEKYQYKPGQRGSTSGNIVKSMVQHLKKPFTEQTVNKLLTRAAEEVGSNRKGT